MESSKPYGLWAASGVAAVILLAAGGAKLAGVPEVHKSFATLGLPGWFGYFIGACEVAAAVGLFIRPLSALAAAGVCVISLGAIYYHLRYTPPAQGAVALVLLLLCAYVFTQRRGAMLAFK